MAFYRIFFRKPKKSGWTPVDRIVVEGEAERDRILARPKPKAVYWEEARIYDCALCRKSGPWEDGWCWFGSDDDLKAGTPIKVFCGGACRQLARVEDDAKVGLPYESWRRVVRFEPDTDGSLSKRWRKINDAARADAHRKVPMPEWPGPGTCRWCLEPTVYESGSKIGKPAKRNWHNACYYQYQLHTEMAVQFDFLLARDGPRCRMCGEGGYADAGEHVDRPSGMSWESYYDFRHSQDAPRYTLLKPATILEVDHVVPLWRVALMGLSSINELRPWFGPINLQLGCAPCHKVKTKREAAERAAAKALDRAQPPPCSSDPWSLHHAALPDMRLR